MAIEAAATATRIGKFFRNDRREGGENASPSTDAFIDAQALTTGGITINPSTTKAIQVCCFITESFLSVSLM
jgi:hypothetical protein